MPHLVTREVGYQVRDVMTGECFRADKLLAEHAVAALQSSKAKVNGADVDRLKWLVDGAGVSKPLVSLSMEPMCCMQHDRADKCTSIANFGANPGTFGIGSGRGAQKVEHQGPSDPEQHLRGLRSLVLLEPRFVLVEVPKPRLGPFLFATATAQPLPLSPIPNESIGPLSCLCTFAA